MSALLACTVVTSCADDADLPLPLTPQQQLLLGRSVDFNVSMADPFQTRTTWIENGTFNEQDLMRIHRQYFLDDGTWGEESYRTYYYFLHRVPINIQLRGNDHSRLPNATESIRKHPLH